MLRAAAAGQPGDAEDLAGANSEFGKIDLGGADVPELDRRGRGFEDRSLALEQDKAAAQHQFGQILGGHAADIFGAAGISAVAEHGDGIADFEDFVVEVRNEDEGDALAFQPAHEIEKLGAIVDGQRGRRLIENDDLAAGEHRPENVDLAAGDGIEQARAGFGRDTGALEHALGVCAQLAPVDETEAALRTDAEHQVFGLTQVIDDHRLLGHQEDPGLLHRLNIDMMQRLLVEIDRPGRGLALAGHDADERALACSVLAQQAVDGAGANRQVDIAQRDDAAIVLAKIFDAQDRPFRLSRSGFLQGRWFHRSSLPKGGAARRRHRSVNSETWCRSSRHQV